MAASSGAKWPADVFREMQAREIKTVCTVPDGGLTQLLNDLPAETQQAWEADLVQIAEPLRVDGYVRLGGVTRIVVASPRA